jgi:hypothetical protein
MTVAVTESCTQDQQSAEEHRIDRRERPCSRSGQSEARKDRWNGCGCARHAQHVDELHHAEHENGRLAHPPYPASRAGRTSAP